MRGETFGDSGRAGAGDRASRLLEPIVDDAGCVAGLASVVERFGLSQASRFDGARWCAEARLDPRTAERVAAAFRLGRAVERDRRRQRPRLASAGDVARWLQPELRGRLRESFYSIVLDASQRLVVAERVSEGTLSTAPVHPREVFRCALRTAGASLIVAHNHPSGDPEPSAEDFDVTRRLIRAGEVLGIPLLDHVVFGEGCWVSLRERMPFGGHG